MNIEIHQPKLEALIQQRMASGCFQTIEDALVQALETSPLPQRSDPKASQQTGADLVAAMQACPVKDFNMDHENYVMPISDPIKF